jgi:hypothetical protein
MTSLPTSPHTHMCVHGVVCCRSVLPSSVLHLSVERKVVVCVHAADCADMRSAQQHDVESYSRLTHTGVVACLFG